MIERLSGKVPFLVIYIASFLYALHYALPLYVYSTFLGNIAHEKLVGVIYAASSLATVLFVFYLPRLLRRYGNYLLTLVFVVFQVSFLVGLAYAKDPAALITLFIAGQISLNVLYVLLNIFLESFSQDNATGQIRGTFLTILNIAILIAPFFAGMILTDHNFENVFLSAAIVLAPVFFLMLFSLRKYADPPYKESQLKGTVRVIFANKNLLGIFTASSLLNFFYAWMIIYTPLYLHQEIGIPLATVVGIIIPIALIPFVLFQIIMGRLADTRWGEQEMLLGGFALMGVTTIALAFVSSSSIALWAGLLFLTRIGAAAVEAMSESYFYKQIDGSDTHLITFFRNLGPIAFIIAPIVATTILSLTDFDYRALFIVLGFLMFWGIRCALIIEDTR